MTDEAKTTGWSATAEPAKPQSLEDFFLPNAVNDGIKHVLLTPDGKETKHWVLVRGSWSDAYQSAVDNARVTRARNQNLLDEDKISEGDIQLAIKASVVAGWSFDQECTLENVMTLFRKNRKLAQALEVLAWNEDAFFDKDANNS